MINDRFSAVWPEMTRSQTNGHLSLQCSIWMGPFTAHATHNCPVRRCTWSIHLCSVVNYTPDNTRLGRQQWWLRPRPGTLYWVASSQQKRNRMLVWFPDISSMPRIVPAILSIKSLYNAFQWLVCVRHWSAVPPALSIRFGRVPNWPFSHQYTAWVRFRAAMGRRDWCLMGTVGIPRSALKISKCNCIPGHKIRNRSVSVTYLE